MWALLESHSAVRIDVGGVSITPKPLAVLPGSFNPLHRGHVELAAVAAARLGVPVHFELSIANVDKPDIPAAVAERRVAQFAGIGPVWLTRAATFGEKAALFPGAAFVLGWDTAVRLIDPRYYVSVSARDTVLQNMRDAGCRIVVGGRLDATGAFRVWECGLVRKEFESLFEGLAERDFRVDESSTVLRRG
jgi:cytidylyltransferase-like protein